MRAELLVVYTLLKSPLHLPPSQRKHFGYSALHVIGGICRIFIYDFCQEEETIVELSWQ